jgi:RNA polymerase sigma-70 factor (ECF subfamily)
MREAEACYRLGISRFPEIAWEWADFARAAAALDSELGASEDEFIRLACLADRPGAVATLEREYITPLRPAVRRICHTDDATDTALQELRNKLLLPPAPRLAQYRSTSSLRAWLVVVATRVALDVMRRIGREGQRESELEDELCSMAAAPHDQLVDAQQHTILRTALRAAIKRLPDEQRYALRMHVISGWNIAQIGRVLSVHRATVARWLVSAKDDLRVTLREELTRLKAPLEEDSPLTHLPSRLDLSLSRVFASTGVSLAEAEPP